MSRRAYFRVRIDNNRRRVLLFLWARSWVLEASGIGFTFNFFRGGFFLSQKAKIITFFLLFFLLCFSHSAYEDALCISILRLPTWAEDRSSCSTNCTWSSKEYFLKGRAQAMVLYFISIHWTARWVAPSIFYKCKEVLSLDALRLFALWFRLSLTSSWWIFFFNLKRSAISWTRMP